MDFHGSFDYSEVRKEEMVTLVMAVQNCAVQSRPPPGVLCEVVQELCQYLAPLLEGDCLLNLEMLDVTAKDPVAPASASVSPTPDPEKEEQIVQISEESCTSEPEEAAHSEGGLDLLQGRYPAIPLGFAHSQVN